MKLFIAPNLDLPNAHDCARRVIKKLTELGLETFLEDSAAKKIGLNAQNGKTLPELLTMCDALIAIGGDGTIFHSAIMALACEKPLLGINAGKLGFLSQLESDDLSDLERLRDGRYTVRNRMVLRVKGFGEAEEDTITSMQLTMWSCPGDISVEL